MSLTAPWLNHTPTTDAKADLEEARNQLKDMQAQLAFLKRLQETLKAQDADIIDICGRLDQFVVIWGIVRVFLSFYRMREIDNRMSCAGCSRRKGDLGRTDECRKLSHHQRM